MGGPATLQQPPAAQAPSPRMHAPLPVVSHLGHSCSLATLGCPGTPPWGAGHSRLSRKCSSVRYWYLRWGGETEGHAQASQALETVRTPPMAPFSLPPPRQLCLPRCLTCRPIPPTHHTFHPRRHSSQAQHRCRPPAKPRPHPQRASADNRKRQHTVLPHLVTLSPTNTSRLPARHRRASVALYRRRVQSRTVRRSAVPFALLHRTCLRSRRAFREQCGGGGGGGTGARLPAPVPALAGTPPRPAPSPAPRLSASSAGAHSRQSPGLPASCARCCAKGGGAAHLSFRSAAQQTTCRMVQRAASTTSVPHPAGADQAAQQRAGLLRVPRQHHREAHQHHPTECRCHGGGALRRCDAACGGGGCAGRSRCCCVPAQAS